MNITSIFENRGKFNPDALKSFEEGMKSIGYESVRREIILFIKEKRTVRKTVRMVIHVVPVKKEIAIAGFFRNEIVPLFSISGCVTSNGNLSHGKRPRPKFLTDLSCESLLPERLRERHSMGIFPRQRLLPQPRNVPRFQFP